MKRISSKGIKEYLEYNYGRCKHDPKRLVRACVETAKTYKCKSVDVFFFMVEQRPIPGMYTHSYGFNTAEGREIREEFTFHYNFVEVK